jgi:RNA polymerase sigma-70 factor (ECF subfamily)
MTANDLLTVQFEAHRAHLRSVAYRMLGSSGEADDAVQESWLRLHRAQPAVENLGGWLTTVVARVCLDMLRSRKSRLEDPLDEVPTAPVAGRGADPEQEALLADSVGLALLVVLDTLPPAERLAFVLHDMFDVPFDEIAPIVGRTPVAARQLASRARRRVRGASAEDRASDAARHRQIVEAFFRASRSGDLQALLAILDPDVVLRGDEVARRMGVREFWKGRVEFRGAESVAERFSGAAQTARLALIDGAPGAMWVAGGKPRVIFAVTVRNEKVVAIDLIADPARLDQMDLTLLD